MMNGVREGKGFVGRTTKKDSGVKRYVIMICIQMCIMIYVNYRKYR